MFVRLMAEGRVLGLDLGDWSVLFGGVVLVAVVALLS
jgi:hypothetical protein